MVISSESQFDIDVRKAERASLNPEWNRASTYKVNNFSLYSESKKLKMFEYIYVDFFSRLDEIKTLKEKLDQAQTNLQGMVKDSTDLANCKLELSTQKEAYKLLAMEKL